MAIYCTATEVKLNHERIPNNTKTDSSISMHIENVSSLIDGHLRGKVALPLTSVPGMINGIAVDLVTYRTLRGLFGAQTEEFQSWVREYKDPAMKILEDIRDCKIPFDPDDATSYSRIKSNTEGREAIFNLADPYDQDYHDSDGDNRYGED